MRIVDEDCLNLFRGAGVCEGCGVWCSHREAHHVMSRGQKGCTRMDIPINLLALGGPFCCACHNRHHRGFITRRRLVEIVARREGMEPGAVLAELFLLLRTSNKWSPP